VKSGIHVLAPLTLLVAAACATTPVNMNEPRRLVGTESDVRVDAEIIGDVLSPSARIPIKYEITNNRATAIAFADLVPDSNYDADTQTLTVSLGAEVPGEHLLPRLLLIMPGEKKSFATNAAVKVVMPGGASPFVRLPNAMRVKLNFLGDPKPFAKLINIPERAVNDPQLANELFPKWVEGVETVYTNALPMRWAGSGIALDDVPTEQPRRSRGRRP